MNGSRKSNNVTELSTLFVGSHATLAGKGSRGRGRVKESLFLEGKNDLRSLTLERPRKVWPFQDERWKVILSLGGAGTGRRLQTPFVNGAEDVLKGLVTTLLGSGPWVGAFFVCENPPPRGTRIERTSEQTPRRRDRLKTTTRR